MFLARARTIPVKNRHVAATIHLRAWILVGMKHAESGGASEPDAGAEKRAAGGQFE
jgi:hypothetical protein